MNKYLRILLIPLLSWRPENIKALAGAAPEATCVLGMWLGQAQAACDRSGHKRTVTESIQQRQTWPHDTLPCPLPLHQGTCQVLYSSNAPGSCINYS